MSRQALIDALKECRPALEAEGATSLFVYGSRARGDNRADSDIDLLVDFDEAKKFSLFNLAGIKLAIEGKLGFEAHSFLMRDAGLVVADILEAIDAAREASLARSYKAFCEDRLARLATERALEIISEAARRLPDEIIERHPEIEWVKIKAIGNILRHEYHRIAPKNR
eukprot:gene30773-34982_t